MDFRSGVAVLALTSVFPWTACASVPEDPVDGDGASSSSAIADGSSDSPTDDDGLEPILDVYGPRPDVGITCVEPEGTRVAVVDCDPCDATQGFGAPDHDPVSWIVTRLVPPSYPYRIDTVVADVDIDEPFEMFYLVDDFELPPIQPEFADTTELEVGFDELATWPLAAPVVLIEGEFLFVGIAVPASGFVSRCEQDSDDEYRVFESPATSPAEWVHLLDVAPVVFGYGEPA